MILIEYLRENGFMISDKGEKAFVKAVKECFPNLEEFTDDKYYMLPLTWDLKEEECLKLLQLTARYIKLWGFA